MCLCLPVQNVPDPGRYQPCKIFAVDDACLVSVFNVVGAAFHLCNEHASFIYHF